MARKRRRPQQLFSISFLDCICCGFGGVLLLFVLLAGKTKNDEEMQVAQIKAVLGQFEFDVKSREERIQQITTDAQADQGEFEQTESRNTVTEQEVVQLEQTLAKLLQSESQMRQDLDELLADKEQLAKTEVPDPVPIPNVQRRQYLTGFELEGDHILFLVRASGSMIGNTIEEAIALQSKSDDEKRGSAKWVRVVDSVRWMISALPINSSFQVLLFAEDTKPLIETHSIDWIYRDDTEMIQDVLAALAEVVPQGGANMERAFSVARSLSTVPDSVVLLTDGLPTLSDTYASGEFVTETDRVRFFNAAARIAAPGIPINTILYPLEGDPASPFLFWQLADRTKGGLVSPARTWPDIR